MEEVFPGSALLAVKLKGIIEKSKEQNAKA